MNLLNKFNKANLIYGKWKFEMFIDNKVFNISKKLKDLIDDNELLDIPSKYDLKKFINTNNLKSKDYFLKISNIKNKLWVPITIKEFIPFRIYLGEKNYFEHNFDIVYFLNTEISSSYLKLFNDQLNDLIKSNIYLYKNITLNLILICSCRQKKDLLRKIIINKNLKKYFKVNLLFSNDNHKEFEGINKVWELSNIGDRRIILYFHGKGLSYMANKFFYIRQPIEKFIFRLLIFNWHKHLETFSRIYSIDKIGILSGGNGWLWFNFWIARTSYLSKLEKPKKTKDANYYEEWISKKPILEEESNFYKNIDGDKFAYSIDNTINLLSDTKKQKYNLGSICKVEKGGFVGLGIIKYTYRIWYLFFVILHKFGLNKGNNDRFLFF